MYAKEWIKRYDVLIFEILLKSLAIFGQNLLRSNDFNRVKRVLGLFLFLKFDGS